MSRPRRPDRRETYTPGHHAQNARVDAWEVLTLQGRVAAGEILPGLIRRAENLRDTLSANNTPAAHIADAETAVTVLREAFNTGIAPEASG
jgi:hypothetical protein